MIDIDEIERMLKRGDYYGHATSPSTVLGLVAEVRRLRAALSTPTLTHCEFGIGSWTAPGASRDAAETAFMEYGAATVTVYCGEKRVYTTLAEFCAAHSKEGA